MQLKMQSAFESPQPLRLFPEKLFYKIGEASRIIGVEAYVLRYWETEFTFLGPRKSKSGQRIYTKKEIDLLLQIKKLLYEEKYTIDGVRKKLGGNIQPEVEVPHESTALSIPDSRIILNLVKERLRGLLNQL